MAEPYFQFKKFRVYHHRHAFKVGTDGVLLGAWAEVNDGEHALDIGTGSGLIALMVAQRASVTMDAIDINPLAAELASHNFQHSSFSDIRAHHCDLKDHLPESREVYDLIVCNPPFFSHSQPPQDATLSLAKHTVGLTPDVLFREVARLLKPDGRFSLIFPTQEKELFLDQAANNGFQCVREMFIHPLPDQPAIRLMVTFTRQRTHTPESESLILEKETGKRGYTEAYRQLTEAYFLRF